VIVCHAAPEYTHNLLNVVSKTINPAAGDAMASFCVVVILGILTPFVVDCTSRMADALGEAVPIPTLPEASIVYAVITVVKSPAAAVLI
jgi:hypothetical protein